MARVISRKRRLGPCPRGLRCPRRSRWPSACHTLVSMPLRTLRTTSTGLVNGPCCGTVWSTDPADSNADPPITNTYQRPPSPRRGSHGYRRSTGGADRRPGDGRRCDPPGPHPHRHHRRPPPPAGACRDHPACGRPAPGHVRHRRVAAASWWRSSRHRNISVQRWPRQRVHRRHSYLLSVLGWSSTPPHWQRSLGCGRLSRATWGASTSCPVAIRQSVGTSSSAVARSWSTSLAA